MAGLPGGRAALWAAVSAAARVVAFAAAIAAGGLVAACGSGGLGGSGIDGSGIVTGRITGFGSVIIGDLTIDIDSAEILVDGELATQADLRIGMIVTVFGVFDREAGTGTAERVVFEEELSGPVTSVDVAAGRFTALGQTVIVNDETETENGSLATLRPGDFVSVSGVRDSSGEIIATWIDFAADPGEIEVVGVLGNLNAAAETFTINGLTVDFSRAEIENGPLAEGLEVEAFTEMPLAGDVLVAEEVTVVVVDTSLGDEVESAGLVTAVLSPTRFVLDGVFTVVFGDETEFIGGEPEDIAIDTGLVVFGAINADGELLAEEIDFDEFESFECDEIDEEDEIEIEGEVTQVIEPGRFVLDGSQIVFVTQCTELIGGTVADIVVGRRLPVFGEFVNGGELRAIEIDFEEAI